MAKIVENYEIGGLESLTVEKLALIVSDMYRYLAASLNRKPDVVQRGTDGLSTDLLLSKGDMNLNTSTLTVQMLTDRQTEKAVTWTTLS